MVFDCNLFLQAVGKGGNHAYGCLQLVMAGMLKLYMSEDYLKEINAVLRRPSLREIFFLMLTGRKSRCSRRVVEGVRRSLSIRSSMSTTIQLT